MALEELERPCARLPINSKCLATQQIKWVAVALEILTTASTKLGREPRNVQVVVEGMEMYLCEEKGKFLDISSIEDSPPTGELEGSTDDRDSESEGNGREEVASLKTALEEAQ